MILLLDLQPPTCLQALIHYQASSAVNDYSQNMPWASQEMMTHQQQHDET
jgi:hypothetical protein